MKILSRESVDSMGDMDKNKDAMPEKTLLLFALDMNQPGAAEAVRMAKSWRSANVSRSRISDFSGGLVTMPELAVWEHKGKAPPFEVFDGRPRCEKWALALWILRTYFLDEESKP